MAARRCVSSLFISYSKICLGESSLRQIPCSFRHVRRHFGSIHTLTTADVHRHGSGTVSHFKLIHQSATLGGRGVLQDGEDPRAVSKEEWKKRLSADQFYVTRQSGTEPTFTEDDVGVKGDEGLYSCVCCGAELFSSTDKYNSGSGWPSFHTSVKSNVARKTDLSHGGNRTEVTCAKCDGHLGHVFPDGPKPTGERYCINSVALNFEPKKKK